MHAVESIDDWIGNRFGLWILVACGLALAWPAPLAPLAAASSSLLFYNIFVTALATSFDQFRRIMVAPLPVVASLVATFGIMPVVAHGIASALTGMPGTMTVGLVLLACLPSGIMSAVWTGIARGDAPTAISVVTVSTLLSPLLTPWLLERLIGTTVPFDPRLVARTMLVTIALPVVLATTINSRLAPRIDPLRPALQLGVKLSVFIIMLGNVAVLRGRLELTHLPRLALVAVAALTMGMIGMALGHVAGRLLTHERRGAVALTFTAGLRNHVVGIILATAYLSPLATMPIIASMLALPPVVGFTSTLLRRWGEAAP